MALGNCHGPAGLPVGLGKSLLKAMPWIWSALRLGIRLWDVLVTLRLQPCAARQLKQLVAGLVFAGVYFSALYGLSLEPEDREVLRAFQRKFNRWRF
ncbi:MAG: hypothetical protein IIA60_09390 [Candidatus Marinimicrobia bacterium]|nr:hypothetical protein [Candidatus Neomarinimicrobiota bacterium]